MTHVDILKGAGNLLVVLPRLLLHLSPTGKLPGYGSKQRRLLAHQWQQADPIVYSRWLGVHNKADPLRDIQPNLLLQAPSYMYPMPLGGPAKLVWLSQMAWSDTGHC